MIFSRKIFVVGILLAIVLIGGVTWAYATDGSIHACVAEAGSGNQSQNMQGQGNVGSVRIVDSEDDCRTGETPRSWAITGPTGPTGPAGPQGSSGPAGPEGATGATGPMGPQGPSGPMGLEGATGPIGLQGLPGPEGATGPVGPTGATGPAGPPGSEGPVWLLDGNAGTNSTTNFLGTTDDVDLVFRSNNQERMRLKTTKEIVVSGNVIINSPPSVAGLSVASGGIDGSNLRVENTNPGGTQWNIYTGDSGCFGDSLGIGPTVASGTGQCGGSLGAAMRIEKDGDLHIGGSFVAGGAKSAVVDTEYFGKRALYAAESPEVRFFDEGLDTLENGEARVELDPIFLDTIEGQYLVHVTPYGNASLYVAEIDQDHFVVKVHDGDPNVAFAWRLSAYRKGYSGVRLEEQVE